MTKNDLQTIIAESLGVSISEKELAYDLLISKVGEILTPDLTIKIPGVGFFQLIKSVEENQISEMIFSPLQKEFFEESENLFIIIELPDSKNTTLKEKSYKIDDDIFSIGIGKPYIPLEEKYDNVEASFITLKKSIEERVNELIAEAEHFPDLNLWEKYNSRQENLSTNQLAELTSNINYSNPVQDTDDDLLAEDITKTIIQSDVIERIEDINIIEEDKNIEITPTDLLNDYEIKNKTNETTEQTETKLKHKDKIEEVKENEIIEIELGKHHKKIDENIFNNIHDYKIDENISYEENYEQEKHFKEISEKTYLGLKKKGPAKIEWNWGDELREELESYNRDNDFYDERGVDLNEEIKNDSIDDILKSTKPLSHNLFEKLESEIKKEIEKVQKELTSVDTPFKRSRYEFVEVDDSKSSLRTLRTSDYDEEKKYYSQEYGYRGRENYFNKTFIILFISFVIFSGLIIYLILPNKSTKSNDALSSINLDTVKNSERIIAALPDEEIKFPEGDDFPRVPVLPSQKTDNDKITSQTSTTEFSNESLYRSILNDTRIYKTIYSDGRSFSVQVSSWRNKSKAEEEVKRLRKEGYDAFIVIANLPEKGGIWYRVRIGKFESLEEAKEFSSKINF